MATQFQTRERTRPVTEGRIPREMESVSAQVPSGTYLAAAIGSVALSATMQLLGKRHLSLFIGQWAPTFLLIGLYNKLVKVSEES